MKILLKKSPFTLSTGMCIMESETIRKEKLCFSCGPGAGGDAFKLPRRCASFDIDLVQLGRKMCNGNTEKIGLWGYLSEKLFIYILFQFVICSILLFRHYCENNALSDRIFTHENFLVSFAICDKCLTTINLIVCALCLYTNKDVNKFIQA